MTTFPDGTYTDARVAHMYQAGAHPPDLTADEIYERQGLATVHHLPSNLSLQADGRGPRDFNRGDIVAWDEVAARFRPFTQAALGLSGGGGGGPVISKSMSRYYLGLVGPATNLSTSPVSNHQQILSGSSLGLFDTLVPHTQLDVVGADAPLWNSLVTSWPVPPSGPYPFQVARVPGDDDGRRYLFVFTIRIDATATNGTIVLACSDATGINAGQPTVPIGTHSITTGSIKETVVQFSHVMIPTPGQPTWACAMTLTADYTPPPVPDGDVLMAATLTIVEL